jgi:hypothetical protein
MFRLWMADYGYSAITLPGTLPNTKLDVRIPLLTYYLSRNNPSAKPDHGIMPDLPIEPSIQDLISGRDPAMERALGVARVAVTQK